MKGWKNSCTLKILGNAASKFCKLKLHWIFGKFLQISRTIGIDYRNSRFPAEWYFNFIKIESRESDKLQVYWNFANFQFSPKYFWKMLKVLDESLCIYWDLSGAKVLLHRVDLENSLKMKLVLSCRHSRERASQILEANVSSFHIFNPILSWKIARMGAGASRRVVPADRA